MQEKAFAAEIWDLTKEGLGEFSVQEYIYQQMSS